MYVVYFVLAFPTPALIKQVRSFRPGLGPSGIFEPKSIPSIGIPPQAMMHNFPPHMPHMPPPFMLPPPVSMPNMSGTLPRGVLREGA